MLFQLFQYNNYESIFGISVWSQLYTRYRTLKTPGVWSSALQFSTLYCVAGTQTLRMLLINSRNLPQMWTSGSRHHKRLCNINLRSILILRARSPHDKSLRLRHRAPPGHDTACQWAGKGPTPTDPNRDSEAAIPPGSVDGRSRGSF